MNPTRLKLVQRAFKKIDRDGSGCLDIEDLRDIYNTAKHPDVVSGKKTPD